MRVKFLLFATAVAAFSIFFFTGKAGGPLYFNATVTAVDEETVYATVTDQEWRIIYRVPKEIRIPKGPLLGEGDFSVLQADDNLICSYFHERTEGDFVPICSFHIIE